MTATAIQIATVRRMTNEPTTDTYSDALITTMIEIYPCLDERGSVPYTWDTSTSPPTQDANDDWIPTYDLNAAAADIWGEKASVGAQDFNFSADGGNYSRSQVVAQYQQRERYYRSRRRKSTTTQHLYPKPLDDTESSWVINMPEAP